MTLYVPVGGYIGYGRDAKPLTGDRAIRQAVTMSSTPFDLLSLGEGTKSKITNPV